jgi:hypothetical protein
MAAAFENPSHEFGVLFFDVFEEFERKRAVGGDKQRFSEVGSVVSIGRSAGISTLLPGDDEPGGPERAEVLPNGAGGDIESDGKFFGGRFTTSFQGDENSALSCGGRDAYCGHWLTVALTLT